jgi:hypothetical protein
MGRAPAAGQEEDVVRIGDNATGGKNLADAQHWSPYDWPSDRQ